MDRMCGMPLSQEHIAAMDRMCGMPLSQEHIAAMYIKKS
jgi:hypothetical protein